MARRVFYSFYYKEDASRIQQVVNIGAQADATGVPFVRWVGEGMEPPRVHPAPTPTPA
jgi:hypothetical protein